MLQINVGLKLCFCETACGWFEWLCWLLHPQPGFLWRGLGGAERWLCRNPGLCSWRSLPLLRCWWSSGDAGAGAVNYREKALLGWGGGVKSHP